MIQLDICPFFEIPDIYEINIYPTRPVFPHRGQASHPRLPGASSSPSMERKEGSEILFETGAIDPIRSY